MARCLSVTPILLVIKETKELKKRKTSVGHTGLVSKGVSNKDAIGMFRVFPFQSDDFQAWLAYSEIPWSTGYLVKRSSGEKREEEKNI